MSLACELIPCGRNPGQSSSVKCEVGRDVSCVNKSKLGCHGSYGSIAPKFPQPK